MKKSLVSGFIALVFLSTAVKPASAEWDYPTLEVVSNALDTFWGSFFREINRNMNRKIKIRYRYPVVYPHQRVVRTPCGPAELAHYCPQDNTIHLNIPRMTRLANNQGDAAAYYGLAHEYGHSVQNQLGLFNKNIPLVRLELQADCLAGVFFAATDRVGVLEPGDLEEGMVTAKMMGDYDYHDVQHHGTPKQRMSAFLKGFRDPRNCFLE